MNFKVIALVILFVVYLWNLFLKGLQARSANNPMPKNVADVYDPETYQKWKAYNGEKSRLSIAESTVSFLVDVGWFCSTYTRPLPGCSRTGCGCRCFPCCC